jgi:hypothetical protein
MNRVVGLHMSGWHDVHELASDNEGIHCCVGQLDIAAVAFLAQVDGHIAAFKAQ